MTLVYHVMSSVFNIALPFGFSFGIFCVTLWSLPMILRFIRQIF